MTCDFCLYMYVQSYSDPVKFSLLCTLKPQKMLLLKKKKHPVNPTLEIDKGIDKVLD